MDDAIEQKYHNLSFKEAIKIVIGVRTFTFFTKVISVLLIHE